MWAKPQSGIGRAAEQGEAGAQFSLGDMYADGRGVQADAGEALKWYRRAAERGDAGAQYNLGFRYANGWGVPEDDREAVTWYRKAAQQGEARAQKQPGCHVRQRLGGSQGPGSGLRLDYSGLRRNGNENAVRTKNWLSPKMSRLIRCRKRRRSPPGLSRRDPTPGAGVGPATSGPSLANPVRNSRRSLDSPWRKFRAHRDRSCSRRTRRDSGAYREYVPESQRSPPGCRDGRMP